MNRTSLNTFSTDRSCSSACSRFSQVPTSSLDSRHVTRVLGSANAGKSRAEYIPEYMRRWTFNIQDDQGSLGERVNYYYTSSFDLDRVERDELNRAETRERATLAIRNARRQKETHSDVKTRWSAYGRRGRVIHETWRVGARSTDRAGRERERERDRRTLMDVISDRYFALAAWILRFFYGYISAIIHSGASLLLVLIRRKKKRIIFTGHVRFHKYRVPPWLFKSPAKRLAIVISSTCHLFSYRSIYSDWSKSA